MPLLRQLSLEVIGVPSRRGVLIDSSRVIARTAAGGQWNAILKKRPENGRFFLSYAVSDNYISVSASGRFFDLRLKLFQKNAES